MQTPPPHTAEYAKAASGLHTAGLSTDLMQRRLLEQRPWISMTGLCGRQFSLYARAPADRPMPSAAVLDDDSLVLPSPLVDIELTMWCSCMSEMLCTDSESCPLSGMPSACQTAHHMPRACQTMHQMSQCRRQGQMNIPRREPSSWVLAPRERRCCLERFATSTSALLNVQSNTALASHASCTWNLHPADPIESISHPGPRLCMTYKLFDLIALLTDPCTEGRSWSRPASSRPGRHRLPSIQQAQSHAPHSSRVAQIGTGSSNPPRTPCAIHDCNLHRRRVTMVSNVGYNNVPAS